MKILPDLFLSFSSQIPAIAISLIFLGLGGCDSRKQIETIRENKPAPASPESPGKSTLEQRPELTKDERIVFEALDLERPELHDVAAAIKKGDFPAATHAWATHVRTRGGFSWGEPDVAKKYDRQVAKDARSGKVTGGYVPLLYAFPEGRIDWNFNATDHIPGQSHNNEWQWQLNRMMFWPAMAAAYGETKDDAYVAAFGQQLRSWVEQCPLPASPQNVPGSTWRTIEVGIRLGQTWFPAFLGMVESSKLDDADILTFTRSVIEQARYLRQNQTTVNWLLMEMNGLAAAGFYFPELKESPEWRAFAFDTLSREMKRQFLPDGAHYELSTGYHSDVVIPNFLSPLKMAHWTGRPEDVPPAYVEGLEKAFDWVEALITPDRLRPKVNDAWPARAQLAMGEAARFFPKRTDFHWLATDGTEGRPPTMASVFLNWSGLAVMRSSWDTDANYLLFDVGPLGLGGHMGLGHAHQDKLNVVLWAYGREILFDNGGSSYSWDKWRIWSRSSLAHNCVIVDGLGQDLVGGISGKASLEEQEKDSRRVSQQPIDAGWISESGFDFASGTYEGPHGTSEFTAHVPGVYDMKSGKQNRLLAKQRRSVLFLKPDIFIVEDTLTPYDDKQHTYQARWHLLSTRVREDTITGAVVTEDLGQPNLAVIPLRSEGLTVRHASAQETPELLGWNCIKDKNPGRLPATTVLHDRSGSGLQHFLTLLLPLRVGQGNPVTAVRETGGTTEIRLDDGRKLIISGQDNRKLSVNEILPDGSKGRSAITTF